MKLYIAGPMTGRQDFNYPAFHQAEAQLQAAGYTVLSPARNAPQDSWGGYMRASIAQVIQADGIAFLPESHTSRGARIELNLGEALALDVRPLEAWLA